MRGYRSKAAIEAQQAQTQAEGLRAGDLVKASVIATPSLALVAAGLSFLAWRSVWWEAVLAASLLPAAALALCMGVVILQGIASLIRRETDSGMDESGPERVVRLVPVRGRVIVEGCDAEDLAYFTKAAVGGQGWGQSRWRGFVLPSGKRIDNAYLSQLVGVLSKVGIVSGYGPRSTGTLVIRDPDQALQLLGLTPSSADLS